MRDTTNRRTLSTISFAFSLIFLLGLAGPGRAQDRTITVNVGAEKPVAVFKTAIDHESVVILPSNLSVAEIRFNPSRVGFYVKGLNEGEVKVTLRARAALVGAGIAAAPGQIPLEQGRAYAETVRIIVTSTTLEPDSRPGASIEVSVNSTNAQTISSLLGPEFSDRNAKDEKWRQLRLYGGTNPIAPAQIDEAKMRLPITGQERGETTELVLSGERKDPAGWRKVFVVIKVKVLGQKAPVPTTPEAIQEKLDHEIKEKLADITALPERDREKMLAELAKMERRVESLIRDEASAEFPGGAEKESILERLFKLLDEIRNAKRRAEKGPANNVPSGAGNPLFDALKRRYERELKPAAENAGSLTEQQKAALRLVWEPIPNYITSMIDKERSANVPRESLLQDMRSLSKLIDGDLEKLKEKTKGDIGWFDSPNGRQIANRIGERFTFTCPTFPAEEARYDAPTGSVSRKVSLGGSTVWGVVVTYGSGQYSSGSSICIAAVHAGAIPMAGGKITIEIKQPLAGAFGGGLQNGIVTQGSDFANYDKSFWTRNPSSFVFIK